MNTTAIFAEILVIGLQAVVWLSLVILSISGVPSVDRQALGEVLPKWTALLVLFSTVIAYSLGIIIDRIADSLFHRLDLGIRARRVRSSLPSPARMRLHILAQNEGMARFLDYIRSRLRIARSTCLNVMLITLAAAVFLVTRTSAGRPEVTLVIAAGLVLFLAAFYAWRRISWTYYKRLGQAYEISLGADGKAPSG